MLTARNVDIGVVTIQSVPGRWPPILRGDKTASACPRVRGTRSSDIHRAGAGVDITGDL